jgi:pimeloyl-ACP methyl ester carboxylesterase
MSDITPQSTSWASEYPFESNWHELKSGLRMHYLDEAPEGDAPAILMVHGNPTWSFYYRRLVSEFSEDYRCVAPDHIGCGLSQTPPRKDYAYTLAQRIADLTELVTHLDLHDITLVIHDWGGAIGMGLAANLPERIRRIVVFNTGAFRSSRIPFSIDICRIPGFGPLTNQGFNGFVRVAQIRAIHDRKRLAGPVGEAYMASWRTSPWSPTTPPTPRCCTSSKTSRSSPTGPC